MRALVAVITAVLATAVTPLAARADDADDLNRIPTPAPSPSAAASGHSRGLTDTVFVEDAPSTEALRDHLVVPFPTPLPASWQNRTSIDGLAQWNDQRFAATLSDRLNLTESNTFGFPSDQTFRNDLRELFADLNLGSVGDVEAGRINVRNGVALGFNPTDFFKTRTLVDQASLDPAVVRLDRLGTAMTRLQLAGAGESLDLIYAPALAAPSALAYIPPSGLSPRFDETNSTNRYELAVSGKSGDLSPQAIVYADGSQMRFGFNASHEASKAVVAYAEWAGGVQSDLIARALAYGKLTGTIPPQAPSALPNDPSEGFRNDASLGGSWTGTDDVTVDVEYELHQAGLSARDWHDWIALGPAAEANPALAGELWYIRGYANDQEEPLVRQQLFLRVDRPDAFVAHLELTAFAFVNLYDDSFLTQLSASYDLSDRWSFALYLNADVGGPASDWGGNPQARGLSLQLRRYL